MSSVSSLDDATIRLVFVDGAFMPHLSSRLEGSEHEGLVVTDLSVAVATHASAIEPHLGRLAGFENNLFAALNTAYLHHGALIIVPRNAKIQKPVHVLFIATQAGTAIHPRCLLIARSRAAR